MTETLAIASGKGGVGKTWLAITLGHALSRLGRRVLLVDGDFGLANVDVQLGLQPERDLGTALAGRCRLEEAIIAVPSTSLHVLPGRSGSGSLASLGQERVDRLLCELTALRNRYDHMIVDLAAGIDPTVRQLLGSADRRYVVTTPDPTALTDAYALIKTTRERHPEATFSLVVNLAPNRAAGLQTYDGLSRVCLRFLDLELALAGVIRSDRKVGDAIRSQTSLMVRAPNSPAAQDVDALAKAMAAP